MESLHSAMDAVLPAANSNLVITTFLIGAFGALSIRSMNQQKIIEALEIKHDSLIKSNKSIKKSLWDWKQELYSQASEKNATVPLSRIRQIYGEEPIVPESGMLGPNASEAPKPPTKFII